MCESTESMGSSASRIGLCISFCLLPWPQWNFLAREISDERRKIDEDFVSRMI